MFRLRLVVADSRLAGRIRASDLYCERRLSDVARTVPSWRATVGGGRGACMAGVTLRRLPVGDVPMPEPMGCSSEKDVWNAISIVWVAIATAVIVALEMWYGKV